VVGSWSTAAAAVAAAVGGGRFLLVMAAAASSTGGPALPLAAALESGWSGSIVAVVDSEDINSDTNLIPHRLLGVFFF